jgi:DNA-binding CsgD family transcriptional regulator
MPLGVLLIEGLAYTAGLASLIMAAIEIRAIVPGTPRAARAKAWLRLMCSVFAVIVAFLLQQAAWLFMPGDGVDAWLAFAISAEAGFSVLSIASMHLYCRFLTRAAGIDAGPARIATAAMAAVGAAWAASFALGLPEALARYGAGLSIGLTEIAIAGSTAVAIAFHLTLLRRPPAKETRRLLRRMALLLPIGLALEAVLWIIPDDTWKNLPFSKYLLETLVLYLAFLAIAHAYLNEEARGSRLEPSEAMEHASAPPATFADMGLSMREREVAAHLLEGKTNKEIAESLFVSLSTVKTHLHHMLEKTGRRSRTDLVAWLSRSDRTSSSGSVGT